MTNEQIDRCLALSSAVIRRLTVFCFTNWQGKRKRKRDENEKEFPIWSYKNEINSSIYIQIWKDFQFRGHKKVHKNNTMTSILEKVLRFSKH